MQIGKNLLAKCKFVALVELLVRQERGGIRRKASAGKCAFECSSRPEIASARFPGERDSRDAALRMTAGGLGRDSVAGARANMAYRIRVVNKIQ